MADAPFPNYLQKTGEERMESDMGIQGKFNIKYNSDLHLISELWGRV